MLKFTMIGALLAGTASAGAMLASGWMTPERVVEPPTHAAESCCCAGVTRASLAAAAPLVAGDYVEARNATVWGGACHISSQERTGGARLVQAWSFDGSIDARAVLVTEGEDNLGRQEAFHTKGAPPARTSILWVDAPAASREAVTARVIELLRDDQRAALEANLAVRVSAIEFERSGDDFRVAIDGTLALEGAALEDRSCCTMPEDRWYHPLASVKGAVVGNPDVCRFEGCEEAGLGAWVYEDENSAYVARFGS